MPYSSFIEPAEIEWTGTVVFILKKDGSICFSFDNLKLNALAKRDAYPILRVDSGIELFAAPRVFFKLFLDSGWCKGGDKTFLSKAAFTLSHGLHRFVQLKWSNIFTEIIDYMTQVISPGH